MSVQETNSAPDRRYEAAPDPQTLRDVLRVLPKDAMEQRPVFALFTAARVWTTALVLFYLLTISPWYLMPVLWVILGTAAAGLFALGHDCAHQSFSRSRLLNEIVGTISMAPMFFPYHSWELTHNNHHAHANNLERDHLWKPLTREQVSARILRRTLHSSASFRVPCRSVLVILLF